MSRWRKAVKLARLGIDGLRHVINWHESEVSLIRAAQTYWQSPRDVSRQAVSHWRDSFANNSTWDALGCENFALFEQFARSSDFPRPACRIVEWGCGGGANAVYFGRDADEFYGVEISLDSLNECARQMCRVGLDCFRPVLIEAAAPEVAVEKVSTPCDLFISFYVFELLPTPEYGLRILRIAHRLLRAGGMAIIQIKYATGFNTQSRRWGYRFAMPNMTTYPLHEFWEEATRCGFIPHAITLQPRQELVHDQRYATYVLLKCA